MQKRFVQVTATAVLFASLAVPAFAHGNDKDDRGNKFGLSIATAAKIKNEEKREEKREEKELRKEEKKDEKQLKRERSLALTACLKDAQNAYNAALRTANDIRLDARATANSAHRKAINDAWKVRVDARSAALKTYLASAKDEAARAVYAAAKAKAGADWQTAHKAAESAWTTAKDAAQTVWKTAKAKADADFKAAKAKCNEIAATDVTAPAAITSLGLSAATASSILLAWTAPGDDGSTGTATSYDIRYSTTAIVTASDFDAATQVSGEPVPGIAGTAQAMTVSGLSASTTYWFAMKTKDEVPNSSAMSNVASLLTLIVTL